MSGTKWEPAMIRQSLHDLGVNLDSLDDTPGDALREASRELADFLAYAEPTPDEQTEARVCLGTMLLELTSREPRSSRECKA